jgi:hypothetical protein
MPPFLDRDSKETWALTAMSLIERVDASGDARIREELRLTITRPTSDEEVVVPASAKAWFPNYVDAKESSKKAVRSADHCVIFWDGYQLSLKRTDDEFMATPVNLLDRARANAY